jgi:hypothetical protein
MKGVIISLILIFCFISPLSADDVIFKSLQFSAVTSINLDTALTYNAIWRYGAKEGNPVVALYIDNVPLTMGIDLAFNAALIWGTNKIYKNNKPISRGGKRWLTRLLSP